MDFRPKFQFAAMCIMYNSSRKYILLLLIFFFTTFQVRSRSQEKGMASKRAELLAETPIIPNTNVGSKLKEILAENETKNTRSEKREKPKGKWDDIMNQIAESKSDKRKDSKTKLKEVKSKVFADFKPPKLIRPNCNKTRSTTSNSSSSSNGFLGESKRMSSRQSSTLASRSTR